MKTGARGLLMLMAAIVTAAPLLAATVTVEHAVINGGQVVNFSVNGGTPVPLSGADALTTLAAATNPNAVVLTMDDTATVSLDCVVDDARAYAIAVTREVGGSYTANLADLGVADPVFTAADYRHAFAAGMALMTLFECTGLSLRVLRSARPSGSLEIGG